MPRITPIHWKILECIFKRAGFSLHRQEGSHRAYTKAGASRAIIIPTYTEIAQDIILSNMRSASMTRARYFEHLKHCQQAA